MANGHAAGVAAALAHRTGHDVRHIDVGALQQVLVAQGQVLVFFNDLPTDDPDFAAIQLAAVAGAEEGYSCAPLRAAVKEARAT
jgi:hypothetical protein